MFGFPSGDAGLVEVIAGSAYPDGQLVDIQLGGGRHQPASRLAQDFVGDTVGGVAQSSPDRFGRLHGDCRGRDGFANRHEPPLRELATGASGGEGAIRTGCAIRIGGAGCGAGVFGVVDHHPNPHQLRRLTVAVPGDVLQQACRGVKPGTLRQTGVAEFAAGTAGDLSGCDRRRRIQAATDPGQGSGHIQQFGIGQGGERTRIRRQRGCDRLQRA